jgi:hypothetical protein
MPKLFRRRIRFAVSRMNNLVGPDFRQFLASGKDGWERAIARDRSQGTV